MPTKVSPGSPVGVGFAYNNVVERIVLEIGGYSREYLLFSSGPGRALVIFLHGTGATAEWADEETGWSRLASRAGFTLALPQALPPDPTLPVSFRTNPPRWNVTGSAGETELDWVPFARNVVDEAFLIAVINDAVARTGCDPGRVSVTGFSNGAEMAFGLATKWADRVAVVAPVAGHCPIHEPRPVRSVPTLYLIGTADPLVPLRGGDVRNPWTDRYTRRPSVTGTLERWARAIGCSEIAEDIPWEHQRVTAVRYPGPVLFEAVFIDGLGHHWPGGLGRWNPRFAGPPSSAIDGTEQIWEFCRRQTL